MIARQQECCETWWLKFSRHTALALNVVACQKHINCIMYIGISPKKVAPCLLPGMSLPLLMPLLTADTCGDLDFCEVEHADGR
eukprot:354691-Chlamydomonas_euryale.AAC.12